MKAFDRITHNPAVMGGKPCIRGMRVTVGTLAGLVGSGVSIEEILQLYPYIERDDVLAAVSYAALLATGYEADLVPA